MDTQTNCCNYPKIWTVWFYHRVMSKRYRWSGKQCRPWLNCSFSSGSTLVFPKNKDLYNNEQNDCARNEDSDQSSLCTQWVAYEPSFLHEDSEDSDQTGRMPRLILVFAGRTCHFVGFVLKRLICNSIFSVWFSPEACVWWRTKANGEAVLYKQGCPEIYSTVRTTGLCLSNC